MSESDWLLRPFEPTDQPAARALILGGLGEHFGFIDQTRNPDLDDIWAHYVAQGHLFIVAQQATALIGTGALVAEHDDPTRGRIVRVSVRADRRRLGLGLAIVEQLIVAGRRRGWRQLLVETNHDWLAALGLYLHCGFEPYARDEESTHLALKLH